MEKEKNYSHTQEFRTKFGHRLRSLRKERGYTIDETCKALNLPRSTYSSWELGSRVPLSKMLTQLASYLQTNVDYLMLNSDNINQETTEELSELFQKKMLDKTEITWKGDPLSDTQASEIADLIESYLNKGKN
ncbi:helix-turn-helix domain-containing protein [Peribacillus aracenensis]|uniref:helix-turn-helix domain-containing protein n=1 Tax=Peribacillus aracenensis TaxID=2976708 RepID=UPI0021A597EA|nr:helix-turn-helix transcriptional regulator [Peribacillus sp. BBB004]